MPYIYFVFLVFVYRIVPKLGARHFFYASFLSVFLKKSKNMTFFLRKKAVFLEKKSCFFVLFFCVRCVAWFTELKII